MYLTIDGDDVGRKITACYIENDERKLNEISTALAAAVQRITELLRSEGFNVIFSAADGVVGASSNPATDFPGLYKEIQSLAPSGFTFSAGVGKTLREAYVALTYAKSTGKNSMVNLG